MDALWSLVQTLYFAALSTWFGSSVFVVIAIPLLYRQLREADPTLPRVLSVNLEGQHATLLGSQIVAALLQTLTRIGLVCGGVVLLCMIGQMLLNPPPTTTRLVGAVARVSLFAAACGLLLYDWLSLKPRLLAARKTYIDHADHPHVANPALDDLQRLDREAVRILGAIVVILLLLILLSANMTPAVAVR